MHNPYDSQFWLLQVHVRFGDSSEIICHNKHNHRLTRNAFYQSGKPILPDLCCRAVLHLASPTLTDIGSA